MSTKRKAGAVTALVAATGAAITVGGVQLASADSVTATSGVNIRSGPGTKYDIVGGLFAGQKITAVGKPENGWIKVRFNGSAAYVSAEYLDLDKDSSRPGPSKIYTEGVKFATAALNVRKGPSLDAKVVGYISDGQKVTLTGKQSNGFTEVLYGGERTWVTAQYLVSSMNDLPKKTGSQYATADLLVRTSTDADFKIITTVEKGTELRATGVVRDGYAQIIFSDATRWVTAEYLSEKPPASNDDDDDASGNDNAGPADSGSSDKADSDKADSDKADSDKGDSDKGDSDKADSDKADSDKGNSGESVIDNDDYQPMPLPERPARVVGTRYATAELLIRTTSGDDFKIADTVPIGTKLKITGKTENGKAQVVYEQNVRWVTAQYLSNTKPAPPADDDNDDDGDNRGDDRPTLPDVVGKRYATTELLIRTTSGNDYKTVDTVPAGTRLRITGEYDNGKAQIIYRKQVRWVTAQYLSKSKPGVGDDGGDGGDNGGGDNGGDNAVSNKGQVALAYAKQQLGKPYVFGAEGPNTFDCSGLTLRAWEQAGVNLPRTSQQQFHVGRRVSMDNLKLGDLVFFYGPSPTHVGLYAGNGMIINAPRPGKVVEYTHISYMPVAGATRPG